MINFLIGFVAGFGASGVLAMILAGLYFGDPEKWWPRK